MTGFWKVFRIVGIGIVLILSILLVMNMPSTKTTSTTVDNPPSMFRK